MYMKIFTYDRYRAAFRDLFEERRKLRPGWSSAQLAEKLRLQPSHLTNVIRGRAHFSSDQIYAIGGALDLSNEEISFLDLLMEFERAEQAVRKSKLQLQVQKLRDQNLRAEKALVSKENSLQPQDRERYWLDPNIELLHLYLSTKGAPSEPADIAREWGLPPDYVGDILVFLQKTGLIERHRGRWKVHPVSQHLPATSPLCKPQQMMKRMRAMELIQKLPADRIYSFSGSITMTEDTRLKIQGMFVKFLKEVESAVIDSESDSLYHLQFDLFPWLAARRR